MSPLLADHPTSAPFSGEPRPDTLMTDTKYDMGTPSGRRGFASRDHVSVGSDRGDMQGRGSTESRRGLGRYILE